MRRRRELAAVGGLAVTVAGVLLVLMLSGAFEDEGADEVGAGAAGGASAPELASAAVSGTFPPGWASEAPKKDRDERTDRNGPGQGGDGDATPVLADAGPDQGGNAGGGTVPVANAGGGGGLTPDQREAARERAADQREAARERQEEARERAADRREEARDRAQDARDDNSGPGGGD